MKERVLFVVGSLWAFSLLFAQEVAETEVKEEPPRVPLVDFKMFDVASNGYPKGSTRIRGQWSIDWNAKKLKVAPEPLEHGWLEFGPEIREKGASIRAVGRAPGTGRLRSRLGVGLYGKNGFQLRIDQGKGIVELVRRGIVLTSGPYDSDPEALQEMELIVVAEEGDWRIEGRVWPSESDRPEEALFSHLFYADDLLFPLAGRPCLVATPFSGEAVQYAAASVYLEEEGE